MNREQLNQAWSSSPADKKASSVVAWVRANPYSTFTPLTHAESTEQLLQCALSWGEDVDMLAQRLDALILKTAPSELPRLLGALRAACGGMLLDRALNSLDNGWAVGDLYSVQAHVLAAFTREQVLETGLLPRQFASLQQYISAQFLNAPDQLEAVRLFARFGYTNGNQVKNARVRLGVRSRGFKFLREFEAAHTRDGQE